MSSDAAAALGRMARGCPKQYSAEELALRAERLAANRYRGGRKPKPAPRESQHG